MDGISILGFIDGALSANIGPAPHPEGINVQNSSHGPVFGKICGMFHVRPHMNNLAAWTIRMAVCIGILGFAYAVAEDVFPALRPGPPNAALRTCEQFESGMDMSKAREAATKNQLSISEAPSDVLIKVDGNGKCVLDIANGRIQRNRVVCKHTHRILFGGAV